MQHSVRRNNLSGIKGFLLVLGLAVGVFLAVGISNALNKTIGGWSNIILVVAVGIVAWLVMRFLVMEYRYNVQADTLYIFVAYGAHLKVVETIATADIMQTSSFKNMDKSCKKYAFAPFEDCVVLHIRTQGKTRCVLLSLPPQMAEVLYAEVPNGFKSH